MTGYQADPPMHVDHEQWVIVQDILARHVPDCEVWAFGSRAKGTHKPFSDLDLAVICRQPMSLATSAALADEFSASDLPWKVDILDWAATDEAFRKIIEADRVVVKLPLSAGPVISPTGGSS